MDRAIGRLLVRLLREDDAQDLIEYALLTSAIGIAGLAIFPSIQSRMSALFSNWGTQVYNLWIPDAPAR